MYETQPDQLPSRRLHGVKRKITIDDFFSPRGRTGKPIQPNQVQTLGQSECRPQMSSPLAVPSPPSSSSIKQLAIPGLTIHLDFITPNEETDLFSFLSTQTWRTDLSRRTLHYGGTYCLMPPRDASPPTRERISKTILTASPLPDTLSFLVDRMVTRELYSRSNPPEFCIVNEYRDDQGISAHVENFRFVSPVCGLTLGDADSIRFHELRKPDDGSVRTGGAGRASQELRTGKRVDVRLPRRSLLVMAGDAREKWQHEICRKKRPKGWRRVSLTFRAERKKVS